MSDRLSPAECSTIAEVRAGVDDLDRRIIALVAARFDYMDAAARIKTERATVRDEWRKADVLAKVRAAAAVAGIDPALIARIYDELIESSIAHEFRQFDAKQS